MAGKRRPKGEGTVYRRGNRRWDAQITIGGETHSFCAPTQRECLEWIRKIREQSMSGVVIQGSRQTLKEYMAEWLLSVKGSLKENTWQDYEQVTRNHIVRLLGSARLRDLTPQQIQNAYNRCRSQGLGVHTIRKMHAVLSRALKQAVAWRLIPNNPASLVSRPKPPATEHQVVTSDQARSLLSAAAGSRFAALYYLALATGLRQGELLGLKWADIDWKEGRLRVVRQLQRIKGKGPTLTDPKTKAGRRSIALGQGSLEVLREHRESQRLIKEFNADRWVDLDLIFPSTIGTPCDQRAVHRDSKALLAKAGLPDMRLHDLRHSAATIMLQEGVHIKVVQERLGHSQISVTLDTYSHVLPGMQEGAAAIMDEVLVPIEVDLLVEPEVVPGDESLISSSSEDNDEIAGLG